MLFYFRKDITEMFFGWTKSITRREHSPQSKLAWAVIFGSIPIGLGGLLLHDLADTVFRSPLVIAYATIGFGILLGVSDWMGRKVEDLDKMTWPHILIISTSQVLALIPGTSRSGITMTAGLALGLTRQAAARFSFLLSIPAILMAGGYKSIKLLALPAVDCHTAVEELVQPLDRLRARRKRGGPSVAPLEPFRPCRMGSKK